MLTESQMAWASQQTKQNELAGKVLLNANENPAGPCDAALQAIAALGARNGRYDFEASIELAKIIMTQEGLKEGYLALYPGASEPLQYSVLAFAADGRSLICADPGYEAPGLVAAAVNTPVHRVPLRADYSHDVKAMVSVDSGAGCYYICNPNNPTGTLTTRDDIFWLLKHKPRHTVVVVDEAYIHYSDASTVLDYALADRDLIVLRSFSLIYGLAGLRVGFAVSRPDLLAKLQPYGLNPLPLPGVVAAQASLQEHDLVKTRKQSNAELRTATIDWLTEMKFAVVPSQTNFFMVDVKRPAADFARALAKKDVYVGRGWPTWPNHLRVSVGTAQEMQAFQQAFAEVAGLASPPAKSPATPPD
jgi:histidinol-phosphate aminotransferase